MPKMTKFSEIALLAEMFYLAKIASSAEIGCRWSWGGLKVVLKWSLFGWLGKLGWWF